MALASQTVNAAVVTPTAFAAPTTEETISDPGAGVYLWVKIGATSTDVTVVRPGSHGAGDAIADYALTGLTNTERLIPITREYRDPSTKVATVQFSQVTNVTALLIRTSR